MSTSKKDYITIAKIFKYQYHVFDNEGGNPVNDNTIVALVKQFCIMFEADNPRFDKQKFINAVFN